ncbi:hypothetical protein SteCoe_13680 [Stentor coeruleus]|uniref:Uncharacterized protein n=1 Tax=Stentor coeruleus TaxID=5963 RepID=A0A1R2C7X5_9CILI|nr:hypothetical protein SteCoe_13680 [Stentor coeruleus]
MGNKQNSDRKNIEIICTQIILAKTDGQYTAVEASIIESFQLLRGEMKNPETMERIIQDLKSGIKGVPSIIYCMLWRGGYDGDGERNQVQEEALKTFCLLLKKNHDFIKLFFDQDLGGIINKLALCNEPNLRHSAVKIMSFLTKFPEYKKDLEVYNPLYTLNSVLVSSLSSVKPKSRILALKGIKSLAYDYKSKFVANGIIGTLLTMLNESIVPKELKIAIDCISRSADEPSVGKNLLEEHFTDLIDKFLSHDDIKICSSTASCIQALCKFEKGRESINFLSLKKLHKLCERGNLDAMLAAKSAMLSLCLNEAKLEYFKKKGWVKEIVKTFSEISNKASRERVIGIIYQLSIECLKYTLYDLYEAITKPLIELIQDEDDEIQSMSLSSLVNLCARLDLQACYYQEGASNIIISLFNIFDDFKKKLNCMIIISMLSITNKELLYDEYYIDFFLSKVDRKDYISDEGKESGDVNKLEIVEEMVKLARLTCIAFPGEEVQSKMKDKLKFVYSQCRSPSIKVRCRAVGSLSALCLREPIRETLYKSGFFDEMMLMLRDKQDEVKAIACRAITNILYSPNNLIIWFKFDSSYVVDASNVHILSGSVQNTGLKKSTGLYADWGKEFKKSEVIKIQGLGILPNWTVSLWFRCPMGDAVKVLIQGKSGTGAIIAANKEYFYTVDQKNGIEVPLWFGLDRLKKGWHHLAVVYSQEVMSGFVNNTSNRTSKKIFLQESFKYFCNSKKGKQPFGAICDFRIYNYDMSNTEIKELSVYNENMIYGHPDKYCEYVNTVDIPTILIQLTRDERDVVKIVALEALSFMASKASCRANMLRNSIIPVLIDSIRNVNPYIRQYAAKCLVNLG